MKKLILSSQSPRRRELLAGAGVAFETEAADIDESRMNGEDPRGYVMRMACEKAQKTAKKHAGEAVIVLGADTIVVHDGEIMGKPHSAEEAEGMLARLSGEAHTVMTAFCVLDAAGERMETGVVETTVHFARLSPERIHAYVLTGEPMDKAGAYGIQGGAAGFVRCIEGSYTSVVGLPVCEVLEALEILKK